MNKMPAIVAGAVIGAIIGAFISKKMMPDDGVIVVNNKYIPKSIVDMFLQKETEYNTEQERKVKFAKTAAEKPVAGLMKAASMSYQSNM
jgi:outer membrane lipoprotein SlyB